MSSKARRPAEDKRQKPPEDKRQKPAEDKAAGSPAAGSPAARGELRELSAEVQAALGLLDSETADAIVRGVLGDGQPAAEYGLLVRATRAVMGMHWVAAKSAGMRETPASLRYGAQTLTMLLTLVHYAYALGIRRGAAGGG